MNPDTHKLPGWFCPADPECDYEVRPGADQPAPLTQAENVERVLKNKQREHSLMLKRAADATWMWVPKLKCADRVNLYCPMDPLTGIYKIPSIFNDI